MAQETISELRLMLADAKDDGERAGLHDAIAIGLAGEQNFDDALEENARAVALRERLSEKEPDRRGYLAISLFNRCSLLRRITRFDDAIVAYASSLEIWQQIEPTNLSRIANNAECIGILLSEQGEPALAARFDGIQALSKSGMWMTPAPSLVRWLDEAVNENETGGESMLRAREQRTPRDLERQPVRVASGNCKHRPRPD